MSEGRPGPTPGDAARERRVMELVEQALDLAIDGRTDWLTRQCAGDDALRARAVELLELAESQSETTALFDEALFEEAVRDAALDALSEKTLFRPGDRLGAYSIEGEIGKGGMGVVYLASRADQAFDLRVAIKTIGILGRADLSDRFDSERRILARLRHPNIAHILDGGTTQGGIPYLVMEYVEGQSLITFCDQRRLLTEERLELFLQICDGVDHAHRNLVVHRDLKPGNILVTEDGRVKLLDFGVAKMLDDEGHTSASTATMSGARALTPEYASPEQVRLEAVTTSSDIYSLGIILYELLTGSRPYELPDRTPQSLLRVVCETDAPLPSRIAERKSSSPAAVARDTTPSRLARRLRGDLDNIVLMALRKEPERRYGSVSALAEDIRSHLAGEPVRARALTLSYLTGRFVRRHRVQVLAAALVTLSLMAGAVATVWQFLRASRAAERATVEAARSEKMNGFLESLLTTPDPIRGISKDATLVDLADYATERLEQDFGDEPGIRGSLRRTLAATYLNLGMVEKAHEQFKGALEEHLQTYGPADFETIQSQRYLAVYEDTIGDSEAALARLAGVIAALESMQRESRELERQPAVGEQLGLAYELYGSSLSSLGRNDEALDYYRRAIELLEAANGATYDRVQAYNNMAVVYMNGGDFAGAVATLEEGLQRGRDLGPDPYPLAARMTANLGLAYREQGRFEDAERSLASAVDMLTRLLGTDHPETLMSRVALAEQALSLDRGLPSANEEMESVLAAAIQILPSGHFLIPYAQTVRARILVALGQGGAAEAHIRAAIKARRDSLPAGHWLIASAEATLGEALVQEGRLDEAREILEVAYPVLVEQRGADFDRSLDVKNLLLDLGVDPDSDLE